MIHDLLGWLALAAYVGGWVLSIPGALRRRMLGMECPGCGRSNCRQSYHGDDKVRGELRDRAYVDAWAAIWHAAFWLPRHLMLWVSFLARRGAWSVATLVSRATPLTEPELARRIASQQEEIERLTKQINEGASS